MHVHTLCLFDASRFLLLGNLLLLEATEHVRKLLDSHHRLMLRGLNLIRLLLVGQVFAEETGSRLEQIQHHEQVDLWLGRRGAHLVISDHLDWVECGRSPHIS